MSERYWITGVQLGMLKVPRDHPNILKVLKDIEDKQFIGQIQEGQRIALVLETDEMSCVDCEHEHYPCEMQRTGQCCPGCMRLFQPRMRAEGQTIKSNPNDNQHGRGGRL